MLKVYPSDNNVKSRKEAGKMDPLNTKTTIKTTRQKTREKHKFSMYPITGRLTMLLCIALTSATLLSSCSGSSSVTNTVTSGIGSFIGSSDSSISPSDSSGANDNYSSDTQDSSSEQAAEPDTTLVSQETNKLIYSGTLNIATSDVAKVTDLLMQKLNECGGYMENYDSSDSEYVRITLRLPSDKFMGFMQDEEIAEGNTVTQTISAEDITLQYSDTESRLQALRIQEERLLSYLSSATNVDEMMSIESSLLDVREDISSLETQMNVMDSYISYSTITVSIYSRYEQPLETAPFGERIKVAFSETIHNAIAVFQASVIWFIHAAPALIFIGLITALCIFITWRKRKLRRLKYERELALRSEMERKSNVPDKSELKQDIDNNEESRS